MCKFEMYVYVNLYSFVQFKISVYGLKYRTYTHASSNAVMLVWGSLRLAPNIISAIQT